MLTANGIDIRKAKFLINGRQFGIFHQFKYSLQRPRENITTFGGEVKTRSGTDRYEWSSEGNVVVGRVQELKKLIESQQPMLIEIEVADDSGTTETVPFQNCQITAGDMDYSDSTKFTMSGICDGPQS